GHKVARRNFQGNIGQRRNVLAFVDIQVGLLHVAQDQALHRFPPPARQPASESTSLVSLRQVNPCCHPALSPTHAGSPYPSAAPWPAPWAPAPGYPPGTRGSPARSSQR